MIATPRFAHIAALYALATCAPKGEAIADPRGDVEPEPVDISPTRPDKYRHGAHKSRRFADTGPNPAHKTDHACISDAASDIDRAAIEAAIAKRARKAVRMK